MRTRINSKWNIFLLSKGNISMANAQANGPRIGFCANNISVTKSKINSDGRGCAAGRGLGRGGSGYHCAGSGGAHGGNGGYGGSSSNDKNEVSICKRTFPLKYYFGRDARLEGSGGGNGEFRVGQSDTGGSGGGIVWFTTPGTTQLEESTISANGGFGSNLNYE